MAWLLGKPAGIAVALLVLLVTPGRGRDLRVKSSPTTCVVANVAKF